MNFIKRFCSTHIIIGFIRNSTIMHVKYNLLVLFNLTLFYFTFFFLLVENIRTNKKRTFLKQKRTPCMCMYIAETCKSKGNCIISGNSQNSITKKKWFSWHRRKNSCCNSGKTFVINMLKMLSLFEEIFRSERSLLDLHWKPYFLI